MYREGQEKRVEIKKGMGIEEKREKRLEIRREIGFRKKDGKEFRENDVKA